MISKNTVLPPGGWYSLIWAIWGRADEQGIFFWSRCPEQDINFTRLCPKQGQNLSKHSIVLEAEK